MIVVNDGGGDTANTPPLNNWPCKFSSTNYNRTWSLNLVGAFIKPAFFNPNSKTMNFTQVAALPFILHGDALHICLITSRETGRWVLPKGWPKTNKQNHLMARIEAEEEAGLLGTISSHCIGTYQYRKKLHIFASVTCCVEIYPFHVTHQNIRWPEETQRDLLWTSLEDAQALVEEPELREILSSLHIENTNPPGLSLRKTLASNPSQQHKVSKI